MRMAIFSGHVSSKNIRKYTYRDKQGNTGSIYKFQAALPDDRGNVGQDGFCDITVFNHDGFMKYIAKGSSIEGHGTFNQSSQKQQDGSYKNYAGIIASSIHFGTGSNKRQNQQFLDRASQNGGAIVDGKTGQPINGGAVNGSTATSNNNGSGNAPADPFANDNSNSNNNGNGNNAPANNNNNSKNPFNNSNNQNGNNSNNNQSNSNNGNNNGNGTQNNSNPFSGNGNKKIDISDDDLPF